MAPHNSVQFHMFHDRRHAGELLARLLADYRSQNQAVVLALPRGGVPVGAAIAHALALPLDVLLVHKIGAPTQPELAVGAVAADGTVVCDEKTIDDMDISKDMLNAAILHEQEELARRNLLYRGDRSPLELEGQTAILVDDGLATGYTMLAAVGAARRLRASRVIVAVPVALQSTLNRLKRDADAVVCAHIPGQLMAVGQFYQDFQQVSDQEVCAELARQPE